MKTVIAIVALLYCAHVQAQHIHEIGAMVEPPLSPTEVAHSGRIGVQYKYQPNAKKAYRFSASVGKLCISKWESTHYESDDTSFMVLNSWLITTKMPIISTGIQWNKKLSKRVIWYYGADVNAGIKTGKKDSITFYDYAVVRSDSAGTIAYSSAQNRKAQANVFYSGLQPFAGISAKWNGLNMGLEISGLFVGSIIATTHEHIKSVRWGGFNLRLFAGYSFGNMRKKTAAPGH